MNETIQALLARRSCRSYKPDMVAPEMIDAVIEAGLYAASGMNKQSAIILAVTDRQTRDTLSQLNASFMPTKPADPFYGAPVVLVVLADKNVPTAVYDGSLVMGNLMQAADALGLGHCWIHRAKQVFDSEAGKEILRQAGIEGDYEGVGHCVIGYIDGEKKEAAPRREGRVYRI